VFRIHPSHPFETIRHLHDETDPAIVTGKETWRADQSTATRRHFVHELVRKDAIMQNTIGEARLKHPAMLLPEAFPALQAIAESVQAAGLPEKLVELIHLRASQINGCSVCVDGHARLLKKAGETDERIIAVAAWNDAPYFTEPERAALALTEATTRMADRCVPVPDAVWDDAARCFSETELAGIILSIASINLWNRLNVTTRQPAGVWKP
jgi:AhpD family alkylhydroperoxidase